ncbi:MAG: response regulator transcription factor [Dehalococcoidia bacterium]|nr:response regulator transcription factor [Dehalococcoidia bacterium]MDZ4245713.1 response regulator transcription factor [Dehalococcoidia bacterium]
MEKVRVLLADDHKLFREGLASMLSQHEDIEVVGEARDGGEAIELARELMPDLILMDLTMPGVNGLDATRALKAEMPYVKIVVLTVHDEDEKLLEAVKAGAQGYLLKDISMDNLLASIRGVSRGEAPISPSMAGKILKEFSQLLQKRPSLEHGADITNREQQVLQLVARGAGNYEISKNLNISENTVKNHLRNILAKLHVQNRSQAAYYAMKKGLIKDVL